MSNPDLPSQEEAIALFCRLLQADPAPQIRAYAALTLATLGQSSELAAVALFQAAENDSDETIRLCAADAIAQLYSSPSSDPLNQLLQILNAMSDQPKVQMNFNAPVTSATGNVEGDLIITVQEQDLAEAAAQIQTLLSQLSQTYANESDRQVEAVKREAKRNPTFRQRLWSAAKSGGVEAVKQLLDYVFKNPVAAVVAESIKAFVEAEASP